MAPPGLSCCGSLSPRESAACRGAPTSLSLLLASYKIFSRPPSLLPDRPRCPQFLPKLDSLLGCPKSPIPGPASPTPVTPPPAPGPSLPPRSPPSGAHPPPENSRREGETLGRVRVPLTRPAPLQVSLGVRSLYAPVSLQNKDREGVGRGLKPFAISKQPQPKITLERRAENGYLLPALKSEAGRCVWCVCVPSHRDHLLKGITTVRLQSNRTHWSHPHFPQPLPKQHTFRLKKNGIHVVPILQMKTGGLFL
uniref:synaptojanin-1-like n=1 Tax=Macaca mulatta TaxID=9544 RepID=UPI0010A21000|nr:synaptojanin-1-like [Macaca mulatta]